MEMSNINLDEIKKKGIKVGIIFGVILVLFIAYIFISSAIFGSVLPYDRVEEILVSSAKKYYDKNKTELPKNNGESTEVDNIVLTEGKFMKDISKMTKKEEACTGSVTVTKNGKYYIYTPKLSCGESYKTQLAVDELTSKVKSASESGLQYNSDKDIYIYRGEYVDNYVSFGGKTWRIMSITNEGNLRLILDETDPKYVWDDRYNSDKNSNVGINNFSLSRLKESLDSLYKDEKIIKKSNSDLIIPQTKCNDAYTAVDENGNEYQECRSYDYKDQMFTTLYAEEFVAASLDTSCSGLDDRRCSNYNYLGNYEDKYWTITKDPNSTYKVYKVDKVLDVVATSSKAGLKPVVEVSGKVLFESGEGTAEKPYKVKVFN